ncbi:hypothetical protein M758_9G142900 [Ceratodon purpureus]|nr:hypothetical protein M758_9G142900 [Ceratodon purpureus]
MPRGAIEERRMPRALNQLFWLRSITFMPSINPAGFSFRVFQNYQKDSCFLLPPEKHLSPLSLQLLPTSAFRGFSGHSFSLFPYESENTAGATITCSSCTSK